MLACHCDDDRCIDDACIERSNSRAIMQSTQAWYAGRILDGRSSMLDNCMMAMVWHGASLVMCKFMICRIANRVVDAVQGKTWHGISRVMWPAARICTPIKSRKQLALATLARPIRDDGAADCMHYWLAGGDRARAPAFAQIVSRSVFCYDCKTRRAAQHTNAAQASTGSKPPPLRCRLASSCAMRWPTQSFSMIA